MNKSELIENISHVLKITLNKSEELIDLFFNSIKGTLNRGERVEIRGFGVFTVKEYPSYLGRNPKTGTPVTVTPKRLPAWRTGLELNDRLNNE
ncbi:MAG: HU family DNA-binding protein [Oligoflexales bacterium]